MDIHKLGHDILNAAVFAALGLAVFGVAFWVMTKVAPFSVKKEIEEDQNTALAVIMAGVIIGVAIIISVAIQG